MTDTSSDEVEPANQAAVLQFDDVCWTTCEVEDFERLYWGRIAPVLKSDGLDPETEKPTHDWLSEYGARAYVAALRRHHSRSFGEFWRKNLGLGDGNTGYVWATTHDETVDALETFFDQGGRRYDLAESSVAALRGRLNTTSTRTLHASIQRISSRPSLATGTLGP